MGSDKIFMFDNPAAGSDAYLVSVATTLTNTPSTTTSKVPLVNGSGDQMPSSEISQGNKYFVYYDKCNGIFQVVNHIVTPTAASQAKSTVK